MSKCVGDEEEQRNKRRRVKGKEGNEQGGAAAESSSQVTRDASEVGLGLSRENPDDKKREEKKKKKKNGVKKAAADEDGGTMVDLTIDGILYAAEVELGGLVSEGDDENKMKNRKEKERKQINMEARDSGERTVPKSGRQVEKSVKLASAYGEKEKVKKDISERNGGNSGKGMMSDIGHWEDKRTEEGEQRVAPMKGEKTVNKPAEMQESRKWKSKVRRDSANQEGMVHVRMEVGLEEQHGSNGDGKNANRTKTKRRERDQNGSRIESSTELCAIEQMKTEKIEHKCSSHGSQDERKKETDNLEEENNVVSGNVNKKNKVKGGLTGNKKSRGELSTIGEESAGRDTHKNASISTSSDDKRTKRKKKHKDGKDESTKIANGGTSSGRDMAETSAATTTRKKKTKRVNFLDHVEVFSSAGDVKSNGQLNEDGLVMGKRFSKEEDDMVRKAVFDYIKENDLGEDGLNMVLKCRSYPQIRNCWQEIGATLPWRPRASVYCRAHILFQRSEARKWNAEELDLLRRYYEEHGPKWTDIGDLLGKHRHHVKDTWRRIKVVNKNKGNWSQEEYQRLFDLVNTDLQLKAFEVKKSKHGMIRENISWGAISDKLSTRHDAACCMKWYQQLTSPLVTLGLWADTDDYRLIDGLLKLDASCIEDVEWGRILDNRSGSLCLKRWREMVRHIGGHREKTFMEQVELLATRYCPKLLKYRT